MEWRKKTRNRIEARQMKSASIAAIPGVKEDDPRALFELG